MRCIDNTVRGMVELLTGATGAIAAAIDFYMPRSHFSGASTMPYPLLMVKKSNYGWK
jgi:hypothetical protein